MQFNLCTMQVQKKDALNLSLLRIYKAGICTSNAHFWPEYCTDKILLCFQML